MTYNIRKIESRDHKQICDLLEKEWGSTVVVTRGEIYNADSLPGFIAESDHKMHGLLTYNREQSNLEIISLNSTIENEGIGSALINAAKEEMLKLKCKRLWLITTNDNVKAIGFYEKRGFKIIAVHKDAIEESRKLKPVIPLIGMNGIPIRDEIEMELRLTILK